LANIARPTAKQRSKRGGFTMRILILILLIYSQFALAAEPMGRLFTSPAERSNLDYLRQTKKKLVVPVVTEAPVDAVEATPIVLPEAVNLQGYVKRNDGKDGTVWVNNKALQENSRNKEVAVGKLSESSNRVPIKLSGNGRHLNLKAGQVYDPQTGRVREARNHAAQGDAANTSGTIGD
jgi:hypothetical protein